MQKTCNSLRNFLLHENLFSFFSSIFSPESDKSFCVLPSNLKVKHDVFRVEIENVATNLIPKSYLNDFYACLWAKFKSSSFVLEINNDNLVSKVAGKKEKRKSVFIVDEIKVKRRKQVKEEISHLIMENVAPRNRYLSSFLFQTQISFNFIVWLNCRNFARLQNKNK